MGTAQYKLNSFNKMAKNKSKKQVKRWTDAEDKVLLDTLRVYGHKGNHYCFMIVAEQTGRSIGGVQAHWYTVLSRKDDVWIGSYITENNITKNRKNGVGVQAPSGMWSRVLRMIKKLF